MKMDILHKENQSQAGFAILYAVIVITALSSLGAVLSNLLVRESRLAATSRESSRAYYSADAAQECALFWDLQKDHFPPPPGGASDEGPISCSGETNIDVTAKQQSTSEYTYTFSINNPSVGVCTGTTTVTKRDDGNRLVTEIESLGRNSCSGNFRAQRALRTTY